MTTLLILFVVSGSIVMLLSLPLLWEQIPPNGLYGFRIRATLENPRIWYAANRYAAKRMLWSGAIFVTGAVGLYFIPGLSIDAYSIGCLLMFAAPFAFGLVQSIRYVNRLRR